MVAMRLSRTQTLLLTAACFAAGTFCERYRSGVARPAAGDIYYEGHWHPPSAAQASRGDALHVLAPSSEATFTRPVYSL